MEFAKLFYVKKDQVLITLSYEDTDDAPYKLCQTTEINGIRANVNYCFEKQSTCDKAFKEYDEAKAVEFHTNASRFIKE